MRGRILNPDATKRSIVAVLIGLMVLVAIYLTVPSHPAEPQGILLRIGANGVIVSLFGHTMPGAVRGAMSSYVFRGVAIYSVPTI
ncbi:hypothetical protein [Coxiella burnetii]|uniref:hypothetical protein n=1 Tax=Coxiella burnetii TaxID=777 RepID=UPI0005952116|nr:hypothetical protein [Coxiella burnetii]